MLFQDRISTLPNRYVMTDENGNISHVWLERADEPTIPGTPLNAETFNQMAKEFAPSGYGYGGEAVSLSNVSIEDETGLTNALETIYSGMQDKETKLVRFSGFPSASGYTFFGLLFRSSKDSGTFIVLSAHSKGCLITKTKFDGVWEPTEWENPPLVLGIEYRTTERFNGHPVYVKAVEFGLLPSNDSKNVYLADYIGDLVRVEGYLYDKDSKQIRKTFTSADVVSLAWVSSYIDEESGKKSFRFWVSALNGGSSYYGLPIVYYTKREI